MPNERYNLAMCVVVCMVLVGMYAMPQTRFADNSNSDIQFYDPDCPSDGHGGTNCDYSHQQTSDYSDAISFPDDYDEPSPPIPVAACPNESDTYCEHVPNYPADYIESQISADPLKFEELFGADEVALENRFGGDERPLCQSRETIIFPKSGLTQDNTWMYIVNFKNYVQGIRVEICIHTNQCLWPGGNLPFGFEPICKQKYIYRQLLAIDANGRTVKNSFQVPCCCECVMTSRY